MQALSSVNFSGVTTASQPVDNEISLDSVKRACGDVNQIRMLLKGSLDKCVVLFKEAVKANDAVVQIQLSHAYYGILWGKDNEKDFSSISNHDLDEYEYYPRKFDLYRNIYQCAFGVNETSANETFFVAAYQGYLPAILELHHEKWASPEDKYGFAVSLRPYVGKGDKRLDYYFGLSLKNGCKKGSNEFYEGLFWMQSSLGITVNFPKESESFIEFKKNIMQTYMGTCFSQDGFCFLNNGDVLAPSEELWNKFKNEKLKEVTVCPPEAYVFNFDKDEIKKLVNIFKITNIVCKTSATVGLSTFGYNIESLSVYSLNHNEKRELIYEFNIDKEGTHLNLKLQPVIQFIENVIKRAGTAESALDWLKQLGAEYI